MTKQTELRKEFEEFVDRNMPELPREETYTIVVPADYYDRYYRSLLHRDRYRDVATPAENLLWKGHIVVRGDK